MNSEQLHRRYRAPAIKNVMRVGLNYLSDLIVRPGIEKRFGPLLLYRGRMNRGHAHRLWNMSLLMMASECETLSDGFKVLNNPAFSQLCGPLKPPGRYTLWNFFGRLNENPAVTKNIDGLTAYARMMGPPECSLTRVDRFTNQINCAEWRVSLHQNAGQDYRDRERGIPKSKELFYPFVVHDAEKGGTTHDLVLLVNAVVPRHWPDQIRADVCQDLIVGLLSGELAPGEVREAVQKYINKHFKTLPLHWEGGGTRSSLDAPMPGTEDRSWADVI